MNRADASPVLGSRAGVDRKLPPTAPACVPPTRVGGGALDPKSASQRTFRARIAHRDDSNGPATKGQAGLGAQGGSFLHPSGAIDVTTQAVVNDVPHDSLDESLIYRSGSPFQRWAYEHAARYFHARGVRRYGASKNGNPYAHLLDTEDSGLNFLSPAIADAVAARFDSHKAGDRARAETNTVASQPCCFNLFVPLARDLLLASEVFSDLIARRVTVDHIEIEFTPNHLRTLPGYELRDRDESLGDQNGSGGTDADVAVFYRSGAGRGVILIEFKYIEAEFSTCGSYATKDEKRRALLRPLCRSASFVLLVTEPHRDDQGRPLCGYTKYRNWGLTRGSAAFDWEKIASLHRCPFSGSGQQLWRNVLLAENVARERHLEHFAFWVVAPRDNHALWREAAGDIFEEFGALLTASARQTFQRFQTESVLEKIEARLPPSDERNRWWVRAFRDRYLPPSPIRGGEDDSLEGVTR